MKYGILIVGILIGAIITTPVVYYTLEVELQRLTLDLENSNLIIENLTEETDPFSFEDDVIDVIWETRSGGVEHRRYLIFKDDGILEVWYQDGGHYTQTTRQYILDYDTELTLIFPNWIIQTATLKYFEQTDKEFLVLETDEDDIWVYQAEESLPG